MAMKRNPLVTAINEGIADAKRGIKSYREAKDMLLSVKGMIRAKYAWTLDKLDMENSHVDCSWSAFREKPGVSVLLFRLESFKDARLTDLLYNLCSFGDPEVTEYAEALNKDFYFKLEDINILVRAFVKGDSPTCRKVKVGAKLVEEATYKIVCD